MVTPTYKVYTRIGVHELNTWLKEELVTSKVRNKKMLGNKIFDK